MKHLAIAALMAVPRPFVWWLGDVFRGWRKLLRAALVLMHFIFLVAAVLWFYWLLVVAYLEAF